MPTSDKFKPGLSASDKLQPVDQVQLETELRDLFQEGDIRQTSRWSGIKYGTLTKQLNPNDVTESVVYEFLMLIYGAEVAKPGLGEDIWALASRFRPRRTNDRQPSRRGLEAEFYRFMVVYADFEDGLATREELEVAKDRYAEFVGRVGVSEGMGEPRAT